MVMEHLSCPLLHPQLQGQHPLARSINIMGLYDVSDTEHGEKSSTAYGEGRRQKQCVIPTQGGNIRKPPPSDNFSFQKYLLLNPEPSRDARKPNSPFRGCLRRANPDHSICCPPLRSRHKLVMSTSSRCFAHESSCVLPGLCRCRTGIGE